MKITPILWDYKKSADGKYPVKIRVSVKDKTKYVPLDVRVKKNEWVESKARVHESHANAFQINNLIRKKVDEIEAQHLQAQIEDKETDTGALVEKAKSNDDFYYFFQKKIAEARKNGSHHRADADVSRMNVMKLWRKKWPAKEITVESLKDLKEFLKSRGNSHNTIMDKFSLIRTIVGEMGLKKNPFDKFEIKFEETEVRIITDDDLDKLRKAAIPARFKTALLARDAWLFSYNAAGMRFGDVCRLKVENVTGGRIRYRMGKSKRKPMDIPQTDEAQSILGKYVKRGADPNDYVFPIINPKLRSEEKIARFIKNKNRSFNRALKYISEKFGLSEVLKPHGARHLLADKITDMHAAKELLNHRNIGTTERYKKKFRSGIDDVLKTAVKSRS